MLYAKPWKSYQDQLDQLIKRGMLIDDPELAVDYLRRIGYYRLSGYWYAFRKRSGPLVLLSATGKKPSRNKTETVALDSFKPGATFQNAVDLYVFDKRLRLLALDALERIEIAIRVDVSHTLGKLETFAHMKPELFDESFGRRVDPRSGVTRHHRWINKHANLISRSKEEFVRHNKSKYELPLAVWIACEVWDFGALSTLYGGMRVSEQDVIAGRYGLSSGRVLASWPSRLIEHLESFPDLSHLGLSLSGMGAPPNWRETG